MNIPFQIAAKLLEEADDFDPKEFAMDQPDLEYRHSYFEGEQVHVARQPGKKWEWTLPIGNVLQFGNDYWVIIKAQNIPNQEWERKVFSTKEEAGTWLWSARRYFPPRGDRVIRNRTYFRNWWPDKKEMAELAAQR